VSKSLRFALINPKGDHMSIAGLDGHVYNSSAFTPLPRPYTGCGQPVFPSAAYVVGARAYFADGTGTVQSLGVTGGPAMVARFPLTSTQQILSFAVSPDASRLVATITTLPQRAPNANPCLPGAPIFAPGDFVYDVYTAVAGGLPTRVFHQTFPQTAPSSLAVPSLDILEFEGWNPTGPFGTYPSALATMGDGPASQYLGWLWYADPSTASRVGAVDGQCHAVDVRPTADYLCLDNLEHYFVKKANGTVLWSASGAVPYSFLAPDERRFVTLGEALRAVVQAPGATVTLPDQFVPYGWFDSTTVAGNVGSTFSFVSLTDPRFGWAVPLEGTFVGTLVS
jgi:hypothetical protein